MPFHAEVVSEILSGGGQTIVVENNYSGQFARYLRSETSHVADAHIRKYDGEPIEPLYVVTHVKELI